MLDETDALFMDKTFKLSGIGTAAQPDTQFVFVTATLPQTVQRTIHNEFPEVVELTGPGLHRVSPHIDMDVIDCSDADPAQRTCPHMLNQLPATERLHQTRLVADTVALRFFFFFPPQKKIRAVTRKKKQALMNAVVHKAYQRVLVFGSSIDSCRIAENVLTRADRKRTKYNVLAYHAAVDRFTMQRNLAQFIQPLIKKPQIMICSDRASRGLDFDRIGVDHVVLFDFPR